LIGLWQLIVSLEIWPPSMVPSPGAVFQELFQGFKSFSLVHDILASFKHLIFGLSISLIIGTFFGFLLATFKTLDETVGSLVLALQSVPSIVWVPLAIIWFGFNERAIIF